MRIIVNALNPSQSFLRDKDSELMKEPLSRVLQELQAGCLPGPSFSQERGSQLLGSSPKRNLLV